MKTRLLNLLRWRLHNQNGSRRCKHCTETMERIIKMIALDMPIEIRLNPDVNISGICTGYHIELIDNKNQKQK